MIRSIVISRPGEVEQQIDFKGNTPDGIMLVLEDGRILCVGGRDGYQPDRIWIIDQDGADGLSLPLAADPVTVAQALRREASRILQEAGRDPVTLEPVEVLSNPVAQRVYEALSPLGGIEQYQAEDR